jgi:hypothetical protein
MSNEKRKKVVVSMEQKLEALQKLDKSQNYARMDQSRQRTATD